MIGIEYMFEKEVEFKGTAGDQGSIGRCINVRTFYGLDPGQFLDIQFPDGSILKNVKPSQVKLCY